jgi:recombination protein RecT
MNAVAKVTPMAEVCNALVSMKPDFEEALKGSGVSVDRFVQVGKQALQMHRDIAKLLSADRKSLYLSFRKAASDGLMIDGREAALVVFGTEATYMPMTQGLVKLARNSGEIANIEANVVYSKDKFTYIMGQDQAPRHEADWFGDDRGEPVGAWALVTLASGEKIPAMLSKNKIMRIASKSKNAGQYDCKNGFAWEEWWKKTAVKNVLKYAPRSTALDEALQHDNEVSPIDVTPEPETPPATAIETPKRKSRLDKVKEDAAMHVEHTPVDQQEMPEIPPFLNRQQNQPLPEPGSFEPEDVI